VEAVARPSPNCGERRDGLRPSLVVLHYTAMASAEAALARLCDPGAEVSCHWLIDEDGRLFALVPEELRAWHAGAGTWRGRGDVNSRSIGIELQNDGRSPFPERQMAALERLLPGIMARWEIAPAGVIAHSDMAPDRKADPGPRFDWRRLARAGLSVWPEARRPRRLRGGRAGLRLPGRGRRSPPRRPPAQVPALGHRAAGRCGPGHRRRARAACPLTAGVRPLR
jgi:N-acetylmuramoyl-L-alanine amidase